MSTLNDLFKVVSEGKKQSPKAKLVAEVKQNARKDLDDIFEQLSSLKEELVTVHDNIIVEDKQEEMIVEDMLTEVSPIPAQPEIDFRIVAQGLSPPSVVRGSARMVLAMRTPWSHSPFESAPSLRGRG